MSNQNQPSPTPHVLIFPLPLQGHVTPMLHLAELFCLAALQVTFLNTAQNHQLLTQYSNIEARFARYPGFRFKTIPDGLSSNDQQPQTSESRSMLAMLRTMSERLAPSAEPLLRELLFGSVETAKVTCFIIDGWLSFANDIANEAEVPVVSFRVVSACCIWTYFCIPQLTEAGEIPFKDNEEMDQLVKNVPGMENFLRCRDLPSFCRNQDMSSIPKDEASGSESEP